MRNEDIDVQDFEIVDAMILDNVEMSTILTHLRMHDAQFKCIAHNSKQIQLLYRIDTLCNLMPSDCEYLIHHLHDLPRDIACFAAAQLNRTADLMLRPLWFRAVRDDPMLKRYISAGAVTDFNVALNRRSDESISIFIKHINAIGIRRYTNGNMHDNLLFDVGIFKSLDAQNQYLFMLNIHKFIRKYLNVYNSVMLPCAPIDACDDTCVVCPMQADTRKILATQYSMSIVKNFIYNVFSDIEIHPDIKSMLKKSLKHLSYQTLCMIFGFNSRNDAIFNIRNYREIEVRGVLQHEKINMYDLMTFAYVVNARSVPIDEVRKYIVVNAANNV